jgi:hypothetical protein
MNIVKIMNYLWALVVEFLIFIPIKTEQILGLNNEIKQINILLSLPDNDTYKFSKSKVHASLDLAIRDFKTVSFQIKIIPGECDCSSVTATQNAMENVYRFKYQNRSQNIQAIFGPMCD